MRAKRTRKRKRTAYQIQKDKTWRAFSRMIRTRDCLATTGSEEFGRCCTCGGTFPFKDLQAGHFIPGRANSILFDERGVHAQCRGCNVFGGGQPALYEQFMQQAYGLDVIAELRAARSDHKKFTIEELREMQVDFQRRTELLFED